MRVITAILFWSFLPLHLLAAQKVEPSLSAQDIYVKQALAGDLSSIETQIAGLKDEQIVLEQYQNKFQKGRHEIALDKLEDEATKQLMALFISYWMQSLQSPDQRNYHEEQLQQGVISLAKRHFPVDEQITYKEGLQTIENHLKQLGFGFLFGRTQPLLEMMLWKENHEKVYTVELTDGPQTVNVTHIGNFISKGWGHFATHGKASTGGWATSTALFCVCESYDTASEKFNISYLKHEARHFADYQLYPALKSPTLEYRAKLTELSYASETAHKLLTSFEKKGISSSHAAHPLANWHVVDAMKKALEIEDDSLEWATIPVKTIQDTARKLLKQNDRELAQLGADGVSNTIQPVFSR